MYKTIRFEIALCTHTKGKAQRKSEESTEGRKVKTFFFLSAFFGMCLLRWVKRFSRFSVYWLFYQLTSLQGTVTIMMRMITTCAHTSGKTHI